MIYPVLISTSLSTSSEVKNPQQPNNEQFSDKSGRVLEAFSRVKEAFLRPLGEFLNPSHQPLSTKGGTHACFEAGSNPGWAIRELMSGGPMIPVDGFTGAANTFIGPALAMQGVEGLNLASDLDDGRGQVKGIIDIVKGVVETLRGVNFAEERSLLTIAETKAHAAHALLLAAHISEKIADLLTPVLFLVFLIASAYDLFDASNTLKGFKFENLSELTFADWKNQCLRKINDLQEKGDLEYKEKCKDSARAFLEKFYAEIKEEKWEDLSSELLSLLGLTREETEGLTPLEIVGLMVENRKFQERTFEALNRVGGDEIVQKALKRGLAERLKSTDLEVRAAAKIKANKLNEHLASEMTKKKVKVVAFAVLFGISVGVPALTHSHAALAALVAYGIFKVLKSLLPIGLFGIDADAMIKGWTSGKPGWTDKALVVAEAVLLASILVAAIVLTVHFAWPLIFLLPICVSLVVGLGWCGVSWDQLSHKEQKWNWEHPSLEGILELGQAGTREDRRKLVSIKTAKLLSRLPEEDKVALRQKYRDEFDRHHGLIQKSIRNQYLSLLSSLKEGHDWFLLKEGHDWFLLAVKETRNDFWDRFHKGEMVLKTVEQFETLYRKLKKREPLTNAESEILETHCNSGPLQENLDYLFELKGNTQAQLISTVDGILAQRQPKEVPVEQSPQVDKLSSTDVVEDLALNPT